MTKACIDTYEKFLKDNGIRQDKLTVDERKALQQEHEKMIQRAEAEGVDLQSTEGEGTVGDRIVEDNYNQKVNETFEKKIANIASLQKNQHFIRDYKARVQFHIDEGLSESEATFRALESMIVDTNETVGNSPLLEIFKSNQIEITQELNALVREHFDMNWDAFFKNRNDANRQAFIRELINIEKTKNTKGASVTDNTPALEVARGYYKLKVKRVANRILTGSDESVTNVNQRIIWDRDIVRKQSKADFVNKHIDDLDEAVHGTNVNDKRRVLEEAYDQITLQESNYRVVGDKIQAGAKPTVRNKSATLQFKDGETFLRMHTEYSRVGIDQQIISDLKEFARQEALHSFFGANINPIRNYITREARKINKARLDSAVRQMDALINPHTYEYNNTYARWQTAKLLQVGSKLGTAFITALLDIPNAVVAGKAIFGLNPSQTIKLLTGGIKLSAREERLYAEEIGFIFDDMIGRFNDDVSSASTFGGKIASGVQDLAQVTMKASYLQQWTNNLRGAVVGMYSRKLGGYLKAGTQFKDLPKVVQDALRKYGIDDVSRGGEPAWTRLLKGDVVDERGFLDMAKIGELEAVFETAFGKTSMRTNITTLFNDVSKTLIIEGNDWDKAAARFFDDDRTWKGAVFSTINQFKQIPIGIYRKILVRHYKNNSAVNTAAFAAFYATTLTMMGAVVNDMKDYLKGREPQRIDSVDKWTRAAVTGGGWGVVSDVVFQLGGEDFINAIFKGEKMRRSPFDAVQLLGPVLSDGIKLGEGLLKLGTSPFVDDNGYARKQLSSITQVGLGLVPLQNLWWAQMLIRKYIHEFTLEFVDPRGFKERERKLNNRAREERRNGAYNNFIFTDILP